MERIVHSSSDLLDAVLDPDIDHIIFGSDVVLQSGISIPSDKTELIFDGMHENVMHSFSDIPGTFSILDTLGLRETSGIQITFRDIILHGQNFYGIPCVYGDWLSGHNEAVTVTYQNVTYDGPQLCYHPDGLTRFIDCDITILQTGICLNEEVGEVGMVEFEGDTTINHTSAEDAVFWFRGHIVQPYLRLMPDATVTVTTNTYFLHNLYYNFLGVSYQNPVVVEIQPGASLTLTAATGFCMNSNHYLVSMLVDSGASFQYIQTENNDQHASMNIHNGFVVNPGAHVYMQADYASTAPLISLVDAASPYSLNINDPASFVLYNRTNPALASANSTTKSFILTAGQINYWINAAQPISDAGDFEDQAYRKWHRPSWNSFYISGTLTDTATSALDTDLTIEEQQDMPNITELNFQTARVISAGSLPVLPDPIIDNGRAITGQTAPGAKLIIRLTVDSTDYEFQPVADGDGLFSQDPQLIIPAGTSVGISANTPFLITDIQVLSVETGGLSISEAPTEISFVMPPISSSPIILSRYLPQSPVIVTDNRAYSTAWKLWATISGPLTTAGGDTLPNAVVFKDSEDNLTDFSVSQPKLVYTGQRDTGGANVWWDSEHGILCRVTATIHSRVRYSTRLRWEVTADE